MAMPNHILVATDGSDPAARAVTLAAEIAHAAGVRITILTVERDLSRDEVRALARSEGDVGAAIDAMAQQLLAAAAALARTVGIADVGTLTAWGDPAEAILDCARTERADMLVLGRRGRGRLAGLLLGSVSQKLVSLAPCPVVIVP